MREYIAQEEWERECEVNDLLIELGELTGSVYVPERTCKVEGKARFDSTRGLIFMDCSRCGATIRGQITEQYTDNEHFVFDRYCHDCGAKVVDK